MTWVTVASHVVHVMPRSHLKTCLRRQIYVIFIRMFLSGMSFYIRRHNKQWKPKKNGICVANHTSVLDVCVLSKENYLCLVRFIKKRPQNISEYLLWESSCTIRKSFFDRAFIYFSDF